MIPGRDSMPELRRIAIVLGLVLGACSRPNGPPTILDTKFAPALEVNLAASTKTPSGLYYRDITLGPATAAAIRQEWSGFGITR